MEVDYNAVKDAILLLEEAVRNIAENFKEIAEELEAAFRKIIIERQMKHTPVLEIGDIDYCKNICRKPIFKARSCC